MTYSHRLFGGPRLVLSFANFKIPAIQYWCDQDDDREVSTPSRVAPRKPHNFLYASPHPPISETHKFYRCPAAMYVSSSILTYAR